MVKEIMNSLNKSKYFYTKNNKLYCDYYSERKEIRVVSNIKYTKAILFTICCNAIIFIVTEKILYFMDYKRLKIIGGIRGYNVDEIASIIDSYLNMEFHGTNTYDENNSKRIMNGWDIRTGEKNV